MNEIMSSQNREIRSRSIHVVASGSVSEISLAEKLENWDFTHTDIKLKATNE